MALNLADHQYAGDARSAFAFGGSGKGRINVDQDWAVANLTINSQQNIFKVAKAGWVSNFAIKTSVDMDPHATPLLTWDVGTDTDDDEFIAAATSLLAYAGVTTNTASTGTATEPNGFPVAAGDYIVVSVKAAATASGVAGTVSVAFDFVAK